MTENFYSKESKENGPYSNEVEIESEGMRLLANIFYPTTQEGWKHPAVLFIQGWGSRQNPELARTFANDGFVCLTVDLRGHGETGGDRKQFAREEFLADAKAAYDFLAHDEKVDSSKITLFGTSFGAYLSSILSAERSVHSMIFRAPANYPDAGFNEPGLPTSDQPEILDWRKKSTDSHETLSLRALHNFPGKVLVVEGLQDEQVPYQTTENYLNAIPNQDNVSHQVLLDATHSIAKNEDIKEKFKFMTREWLLKNAR